MPGEVEFLGRREDADLASLGVVDEDGLAQAEVGGNGLTQLWRDLIAVEEDAQRVAFGAVVGAENAQKMQCRHASTLRSATSMQARVYPWPRLSRLAAGVPGRRGQHRRARERAGRESPASAGRPRCYGHVDWGEADARFGAWQGGHVHEGQDVFAPAGTPLVAIRDGRVVEKGNDGGRGNYLAMWSRDARRTFVYLHMLHPLRCGSGSACEWASAWAAWGAPARAGATISTWRCAAARAPPEGRTTRCRC